MGPGGRQAISEGLSGGTPREGGTARSALAGFPHETYPVAAKPGTAQAKDEAPTAVFGAFAPAHAPQFAISVLLEESGYGGSVAAPVARRLLDVLSGTVPMPTFNEEGVLTEAPVLVDGDEAIKSEEHTSELQSLMRISYAVFCLKKKKHK